MAAGQASTIEPDSEAFGEAPEAVARLDNPSGRSPILLICEHASNRVPAAYGTLGLSQADREKPHRLDPGALTVARGLSSLLDAARPRDGVASGPRSQPRARRPI